MVAGGAILKLPQIMTVVRSKSARGLSLSSYVLDTVATSITVLSRFLWSHFFRMSELTFGSPVE